MKFLCPQGVGDSAWALHKVQSIAQSRGEDRIDISLTCSSRSPLQDRALDFVRRFDFVDSAQMCVGYNIHRDPVFSPDGCWNYIDDGMYEYDGEHYCLLIPNAALEHGTRLEEWLPKYTINWGIFDHFHVSGEETLFAHNLADRIGPFAVLYPGPLDGNTIEGHNRNMLWTPQQWLDLGARIHRELGLSIVVVGAPYDSLYYDSLLAPNLNGASGYWTNLIGRTNIGELYSVTSRAKFVISYQAGVGIVSTLLKTPTGIFWRPQGDSISAQGYLSFDERMASAWVPPAILQSGGHLPLIYGRHGVDYIMNSIKERKWAD